MAKSKMKRKRAPKSVLKLPDLEQSKSAVLNSLASPSSQRTYDHAIREFIEWYCSEPRLAFNKTVVTRYRISLEQQHYASTTFNLRLAPIPSLYFVPEGKDGVLPFVLTAVDWQSLRRFPAPHSALTAPLISRNLLPSFQRFLWDIRFRHPKTPAEDYTRSGAAKLGNS